MVWKKGCEGGSVLGECLVDAFGAKVCNWMFGSG